MAKVEKMNETVEQFAQATKDSYQTVIDHTVGLQERNVRFAQDVVDNSIKELRQQAESNRAMTQELVERAENQRGAFQSLFEESVDAYMQTLTCSSCMLLSPTTRRAWTTPRRLLGRIALQR